MEQNRQYAYSGSWHKNAFLALRKEHGGGDGGDGEGGGVELVSKTLTLARSAEFCAMDG